jgi:hypothetical protein
MRRPICGVAAAILLSSLSWACSGSASSPSSTPTTPTRIVALNGNLGFGALPVGASQTNSLTVSNLGNSALTISGMTVSGGFASVLTSSWTSGTIAAGGSQVVSLRFAPTAAQTYTGTLTVNGDQTSGTNSATISGAGVDAAPPPPTTHTLSGVVRNGTNGNGISNATVLITDGPNANKSGTTAANGSYVISNLIQSGFTIRVSASGFNDVSLPVTLTADTPKDVSLQPTAAPAPAPTPTPSPRTRIGAICNDGTLSNATGSGACSSHGGVRCWRYSDGTCTNP